MLNELRKKMRLYIPVCMCVCKTITKENEALNLRGTRGTWEEFGGMVKLCQYSTPIRNSQEMNEIQKERC